VASARLPQRALALRPCRACVRRRATRSGHKPHNGHIALARFPPDGTFGWQRVHPKVPLGGNAPPPGHPNGARQAVPQGPQPGKPPDIPRPHHWIRASSLSRARHVLVTRASQGAEDDPGGQLRPGLVGPGPVHPAPDAGHDRFVTVSRCKTVPRPGTMETHARRIVGVMIIGPDRNFLPPVTHW
jgi:hypothetical protein